MIADASLEPNSGNSGDSGRVAWPKPPPDVRSFAISKRPEGAPPLLDVHPYSSTFFVARYGRGPQKTIRPIRRTTTGSLESKDPPGLLPLYGAAVLSVVVPGSHVLVTEGEGKADELRTLGFIATTSAHGADSAHRTDWSLLADASRVTIVPDNNAKGAEYANHVAYILRSLKPSLPIFVAPIGEVVADELDVADYMQQLRGKGLSSTQIRETIQTLIQQASHYRGHPTEFDGWPDVEPFAPGEPEAFPRDALPVCLREIAEAYAAAVPVDVAAVAPLIAAQLGGCAGNAFSVEPSGRYSESNLSVAVVLAMTSGERKTSLLGKIAAPLYDAVAENAKEIERVRRTFEERRRVVETRATEILTKSKRSAEPAADVAMRIEEMRADLGEPPIELIGPISNGTPEGVLDAMARQGGCCLVLSSEGRDQIEIILGLYRKEGRSGDAIYLAGYSGDPITNVRASRERKNIAIPRPALSMLLMTQQDRLEELAASPELLTSGFLTRVDLVHPPSMVGRRQGSYRGDGVPQSIRSAWTRIVRAIFERWLSWIRTAPDRDPILIRFSSPAFEAMGELHDELETRMADGGDLEAHREIVNKTVGKTVRLAALFHLAEHGSQGRIETAGSSPVGIQCWEHAERFTRWAQRETIRNLSLSTESEHEKQLRQLFAWVSKDVATRRTLIPSDLSKAGVAGCASAADAVRLLALAVERGLARRLPRLPGEEAERVEINPKRFTR